MSPETPIPLIGQQERVFARPSWADPEFVLASNEFSPQSVTITGGQVKQIAANDPKRWVLVIVKQDPSTSQIRLWPNGADESLGITMEIGDNLLRLSLFDYGPIVCFDWYATGPANCNLDVWSIQVGPRG